MRRPLPEARHRLGGVVDDGGTGRGPDGLQSQTHVDVRLAYSLHLFAALLNPSLAGCEEPLPFPGGVGLAHLSIQNK